MSGVIPGTTVHIDPDFGVEVQNSTDIPTSEVYGAMTGQQRQLLAALGSWTGQTRGLNRRNGNLFHRDRYVLPDSVFEQMETAYHAVENDDVVSGVLDSTESLAFSRMSFNAEDLDEQEVYNQIAEQIDLDSRLREMWRELFTVSQFYCGVWWEDRTIKLRGSNRKKSYRLRVPTALTILDPLKIVPMGMTMFNRERLCWIADRGEQETFNDDARRAADPIMNRIILGKYEPSFSERKWLGDLGVDPNALYEINPANVFRHTATRPQYQRFASVRMKSVFPLLDLKENLRAMDRAHLIGGTNFIVVITQGSDQHPARPEEIAHLQASVKIVAQTPVLVGDHRLDVKIITPKLDATLESKRYDTIDTRIAARLYQMFLRSSGGERTDKGTDLLKVVAAGMESRRKMLRRTIEANVLRPMFDNNPELKSMPKLEFHPKQIALDFNDALASFMLDLRESREISRHTILSQFGFSQEFEAAMLEREDEHYDEIFQTINPNNQGQPGSGTGPEPKPSEDDPKRAGRRRGGAAPGSGQGKAPRGRPKEDS